MAFRRVCCCKPKLACLGSGITLTVILVMYTSLWIRSLLEYYSSSTQIFIDYVGALLVESSMQVMIIAMMGVDVATILATISTMVASQRSYSLALWYLPVIILGILSCFLTMGFVILSIIIVSGEMDSSDNINLNAAVWILSVIYGLIGISRILPLVLTVISSTSRMAELRKRAGSGTHALVSNDYNYNKNRQQQSQQTVEEWWSKSDPSLQSSQVAPPVRNPSKKNSAISAGSRQNSSRYLQRWNSIDTTTIYGGASDIPQFYSKSLVKEDIQSGQYMGVNSGNIPHSQDYVTEINSLPRDFQHQIPRSDRSKAKNKKNKKSKGDKKRSHRPRSVDYDPPRSFRSLDREMESISGLSYNEPLYFPRAIPRPNVYSSNRF